MTMGWWMEMGIRLSLAHKLVVVGVGSLALCLGAAAAVFALFREDRNAYLTLPRGAYHPSFFFEYDLARRNHAGWLRDPRLVAQRYAGITRLCPNGTVQELPAAKGQATFVFINQCWAGVFAAKKYRVELIRRDTLWEIEWSGVLYKCARNLADIGNYLLVRNPLRQMRSALVVPVNNVVKSIAYNINPWHTACPY